MKIAIAGSMQHTEKMIDVAKKLEEMGHMVFLSGFAKYYVGKTAGQIEKLKNYHKKNKDAIREFWKKMQKADVLLVLNLDKDGVKNYIGGNTLMEIGFAHILKQKIFLYNPIPKIKFYKIEIEATKPTIINRDLKRIKL